MQAARRDDPQADEEVETVKAAFLAKTHGDVRAAFEMLALHAVATVRDYEHAVSRHVSHGFLRLPPQPRPPV